MACIVDHASPCLPGTNHAWNQYQPTLDTTWSHVNFFFGCCCLVNKQTKKVNHYTFIVHCKCALNHQTSCSKLPLKTSQCSLATSCVIIGYIYMGWIFLTSVHQTMLAMAVSSYFQQTVLALHISPNHVSNGCHLRPCCTDGHCFTKPCLKWLASSSMLYRWSFLH